MQGQGIQARARVSDIRALGAAVREIRVRRGYSQEALGDIAGMHRNFVGAIERGETNPTFRTLLHLTGALAVPLSALVLVYERRIREAPGSSGVLV